MNKLRELGIETIDMVVVNLYPFRKTIEKEGVELPEAIENIDIGGPSMLRAAAKNYKYVTVVVDPRTIPKVISKSVTTEIQLKRQGLSLLPRFFTYRQL